MSYTETLKEWAEKELKTRHKIEKNEPLEKALTAVCDAAREYGDTPDWLIESTLATVARKYYRK